MTKFLCPLNDATEESEITIESPTINSSGMFTVTVPSVSAVGARFAPVAEKLNDVPVTAVIVFVPSNGAPRFARTTVSP